MNDSGNYGHLRAHQGNPASHQPRLHRLHCWISRAVAPGMAAAGFFLLGTAGCKSNATPATIVSQGPTDQNAQDPAAANLAQPYTGGSAGGYGPAGGYGSGVQANGTQANGRSTRVLGTSQSYSSQASGESYPQNEPAYGYGPAGYGQDQGAPIVRQAPYGAQGGSEGGYGYADTEEAGEQAIAETEQAPPPLPEYDQPPAPEANDLWTPGYWNYASAGYYWVPGVWCAPPFYGALWTPPWWGADGGRYRFHRGYWGPHIGYYGGINYGFGYVGTGYYGGYWRGRDFYYNRTVTNVNVERVRNVYERTVVVDGRQYGPQPLNRTSYNGGRGGLNVQPQPAELAAAREAHHAPVPAQRDNRVAAAANRAQFFQANGGRPSQAFANRPIGPQGGIAEAPREQPFNRPENQHLLQPGSMANGGRPAAPAGARPGLPEGRPGGFQPGAGQSNAAQPGTTQTGVRPGFNSRQPGAQQPGFQQPGFQQPGHQQPGHQQPGGQQPGGQQSGSQRVGNQQAGNQGQGNRQNAINRQGTPAYSNNQPGSSQQPGPPSNVRPGFDNRQSGVPQGSNRPNFYNRQQVPTNQPANRPAPPQPPPVAQPAVRPDAGDRQPGFQQPGNRPNFDNRQAAPALQSRPAPAYVPRSEPVPQAAPTFRPQTAPAFRPQPAPQAAPASRPAPAPQAAPAPHGGGGTPHGEHG